MSRDVLSVYLMDIRCLDKTRYLPIIQRTGADGEKYADAPLTVALYLSGIRGHRLQASIGLQPLKFAPEPKGEAELLIANYESLIVQVDN